MGGVVAGSAILAPRTTGSLHTVTLTINNKCNLACPHCYLHYHGTDRLISPDTLDFLWRSDFAHVAIVGMEPLVTQQSADLVEYIARRASSDGKTSSIITNGINLTLLSQEALEHLSFIDISLDGGEATYSNYRKGSLSKIKSGMTYLRNHNFKAINALQTLNNTTKYFVDDMMSFTRDHHFDTILFSPFVPTFSGHQYLVEVMTVRESLRILCASKQFMDDPRAELLIDTYHCVFEGISITQAQETAESLGMTDKVRFVSTDPTKLGVMRLTYDGLVLSSYDALNTSTYTQYGVPVKAYGSLNEHYTRIADHFRHPKAA